MNNKTNEVAEMTGKVPETDEVDDKAPEMATAKWNYWDDFQMGEATLPPHIPRDPSPRDRSTLQGRVSRCGDDS